MIAIARALPAVACCLWALLAARLPAPPSPVAAGVVHLVVREAPTGAPNAIEWLVVSPRDPRTLYVGRYGCPMVFLRSRDAGRTWRSLLDAAQICIDGSSLGEAGSGNALTGPLQIAADGRSLFLDEFYAPLGPSTNRPTCCCRRRTAGTTGPSRTMATTRVLERST